MADTGPEDPSGAQGPDAAPRPTRRRRRWVRRAVLAVVVVLVAWTCVGVVALLAAARSADEGVATMQRAGRATGSLNALVRSLGGRIDDGTTDGEGAGEVPAADAGPLGARAAARSLRSATEDFRDAGARVSSAAVAPLRVLPVLGRQLRSVEAMSSAAASATSSTADALDELVEQLQGDTGGSSARLEAARQARSVLEGLDADLDGLHLGPDEGLLPAVGEARDRFVQERLLLRRTLATATTGLTGVISFLQGPNRYLVLAANNAEMRAGSGMFLAAGELTVADGRFELGDVVPTEPLLQAQPATTLDPDVAALWGWVSPDRDLRNVNVTPRFDESARMAVDLWRAAGGNDVDGVLALDVRGLQDLLEVVGPVQVQGVDGPLTVAADTVRQTLLVDQYRRFTDQAERRDSLADVAGAVFSAFNERRWSAAGLVSALEGSGAGRNLLLWSRRPDQQAAWEALGAAGTIAPDSVLLSLVSRSGNKLDQFLDVRATMDWAAAPPEAGEDLRRVRVVVDVANTAPERLPRYIEGPHPGTDLAAGEYRGVLTLTIPAGGGNPTVEGAELALSGPDGPARVVGAQLQLPRGASAQVVITFDLPREWGAVTVLPSGRIPPVTWVVDGEELGGRRPTTVEIDHG